MKELYQLFLQSDGVCTDSRSIQPNQLYFALKGERFDGHNFVDEVLQKGAHYCIVDDPSYNKEKCFLVEDVLQTLQGLANHHRKELNIPIISLTGSNGKTTSKKIISQILACKYKVTATKGNLNNHIGVPLSLLSLNQNTEIGVIEMGANHQKEIDFLCGIAAPNYGYITNFGKAHLEGFGGVEGVIKGKSELYNYIIAHKGKLFVNSDDPIQMEKSAKGDCIYFGQQSTGVENYQIKFVDAQPTVRVFVHETEIQTNLIGAYNFTNIASGIAIGLYFGISLEAIKKVLENFEPEGNRSEIISTAKNKILLDAYNANPTSMEAAIKNFESINETKKVLILGDMFEVGDTSMEEHQKIAQLALDSSAKQVYLCGENFFKAVNYTDKKLKIVQTTLQLKELLAKENIANAFILLKGSRGMALEKVLEVL